MSDVMIGLAEPEKKGRRRAITGLLVEDDPAYARLVQEWIGRASEGGIRLEHSGNLSSALARLENEPFDLILLDLVLPDSRGYESFVAVAKKFPHIPIIVLTGMSADGQALRALRHGAQDYLLKGRVDGEQLMKSILYAVERKKIVQREEDFFQNVNHELRNPLTAIHTAVMALREGSYGEINDNQRELLDIAMRNTKHLWSMVDDLLDIARMDMGKIAFAPRGVALADALEEQAAASAAAAAEKKISLAAVVPADLPPAYADPVRLRQILLNLIGNALKFTPEGGAITLSARVWEKNDAFLLVGVADTGPGMEAREKGRIFERRYQSESRAASPRKGLGIGLYVCHQLIARHGGKIWAESAPGQGSCFSFTLPAFSLTKALRSRAARGAAASWALVSIEPPAARGESSGERLRTARRALSADPEFARCLLPISSRRNENSPLFLLLSANRAGAAAIAERLCARFDLPVRSFPLPSGGASRLAALIGKRMKAGQPPAPRARERRD